jgi:NitT/TauT family transport system substrate-binding protein
VRAARALAAGLLLAVAGPVAAGTPLLVGLSGAAIYRLPLYAATPELFAAEGLDVTLVSFGGGAQVAAALAAGSVDVGAMGLEATLAAIQAGQALRVFYAPSNAPDGIWFARPGIAGWSDLRGGTLGIAGYGSLADLLSRHALRRQGLEPGRDVQLRPLGAPATRLLALRAGRVDATLLYPPQTYAAQAAGLTRLGSMRDLVPAWPATVLVTRERTLAERTEALEALLRGYVRALRLVRQDRERGVHTVSTRLEFSRVDAERAYDEVIDAFDERGRLPAAAMPAYWQVLVAAGEVGEPWPEARFFDRRLVDRFEAWAPR